MTDGQEFPAKDRHRLLVARMRAAIQAGCDWVQIREKTLPTNPLLALAREAVQMAAREERRAGILVNGRLDVALAAGASGVHLGGGSMPAGAVAAWRSKEKAKGDFLIGVSCHSSEEAQRAEESGADYIFFGPVFDTPSKKSFGATQGVERLEAVCRKVKAPVLAIGGINESNAFECLAAGASGVAAIRLFQEARDPAVLADLISRLRDFH